MNTPTYQMHIHLAMDTWTMLRPSVLDICLGYALLTQCNDIQIAWNWGI